MEKMAEPMRQRYPMFHIDLEHLPEAKSWKIGKKYRITLDVVQRSLDTHEEGGREMGHVGFDIVGIEAGSAAKKEKVARYDVGEEK